MVTLLHDLLEQGLAAAEIPLPPQTLDKLIAYLLLLEKWNQTFNLTAVRDPKAMVLRHLLDSLVVLPYIEKQPILDVGTGAGLPGIPLALALPQYAFVLLDSNHKRVRFLRQVVLELGITNVQIIQERIEWFQAPKRFEIIVSRAFSSASELIEKSLHVCASDGRWLLMKGRYKEEEFKTLAKPFTAHKLLVPGLAEERHLVVVRNATAFT